MTGGTFVSEDDLHALVDERLPPSRRSEVEAWLAAHPDSAARVADYRAQRSAIRAALDPVLDEPVPSFLNPRHLNGIPRRQWITPQAWWPAAAAILLLVGGAGGWFAHDWTQPQSRGINLLAQEAAASYAVYAPDAARPIEIAGAQKALLDQWISTRIGHAIRAPDLGAAGFTLMGGRLVATVHGPAGLFLYRNDAGTRVAMLVRPMEIDKVAAMREHSIGATDGLAWADDGMGFSLVGPSAMEGLDTLAAEARRQMLSRDGIGS